MKRRSYYPLMWFLIFSVVLTCSGCETMRRKFVRKPKKKSSNAEEMVISPRDYGLNPLPNSVLYKQYFTYWRSWNQELVASLQSNGSHKKMTGSAERAIVNLKKMKTYLDQKKADELEVFIKKSEALYEEIEGAKGVPATKLRLLRYRAERILSSVNRNFDLTKMKEHLI